MLPAHKDQAGNSGSYLGNWNFGSGPSPMNVNDGYGNAWLGNFNNYSEGSRNFSEWWFWQVEFFAQDSWKATRKLTIEFGVRHSIWPPWHSRWGSLAEFLPAFYDRSKAPVIDPRQGFIVSGDPYNGIVLPGNGVPSATDGDVPHPTASIRAPLRKKTEPPEFVNDIVASRKSPVRDALGSAR